MSLRKALLDELNFILTKRLGVRTQTVSKKRGPVKQVCIGVLFEDSSDDDDPLAAYAIHQLGKEVVC
jgi:hypothetical protein